MHKCRFPYYSRGEAVVSIGVMQRGSAVRSHTNLRAHGADWAGGATRERAGADEFSERHQQPVALDPVAAGEFGFQGRQGLFRGARRHIAPAIADPMNMDVHTDEGLTARDAQGQVGAFRPDPCEPDQHGAFTGELPAHLLLDAPRDLPDLPRLALVEGAGGDLRIDLVRGHFGYGGRG